MDKTPGIDPTTCGKIYAEPISQNLQCQSHAQRTQLGTASLMTLDCSSGYVLQNSS